MNTASSTQRLLPFFTLISWVITAQTVLAQAPSSDGWISVTQGNCPLIISAPHGGRLQPDAMANRTYGVVVPDENSDLLAKEFAAAIESKFEVKPYLIICNLRRNRVDMNRAIEEAAQENPAAEQAWAQYHQAIEKAKAAVTKRFGRGLYLDIHGHGHKTDILELGYLIKGSSLSQSGAELERLADRSSIRALSKSSAGTFADLLHGQRSFGAMLQRANLRSVPSPAIKHPGGAAYFNGGYSTLRHGSRNGGTISGIQIELPRVGFRDKAVNRTRVGNALADATENYFQVNYAHSLSHWKTLPASKGKSSLTSEQSEFFEKRIRPVLVEQCYECHNSSGTSEAGLALDHRKAFQSGGDSGPLLDTDVDQSLFLKVIRHQVDGVEMPEGGDKLSETIIAGFRKWIEMGAPDPRDAPPSQEDLEKSTSWEAVREKRKKWWSFQPIVKTEPHDPSPSDDVSTIDRFVRARLQNEGLEAAATADRATLARRLYFALIGLPPTSQQVDAFVNDPSPQAYTNLVDSLLGSEHFGERWARHWMDWIRYAESHGSEGDPRIEGAFHYRDYLIRALNQDVPYDQLVSEHIAGDLLEKPRINKQLGINESIVGTAHWRMVFHGFAPTDALDEKVRFTDDAINAFSKAFLGLTVSCARCHNHKFDPISQADYYAMFGILGSTRPGRSAMDLPDVLNKNRGSLSKMKPRIRKALSADWQQASSSLSRRLLDSDALWKDAQDDKHLMHSWNRLRREVKKPEQFQAAWQRQVQEFTDRQQQRDGFESQDHLAHWRLGKPSDFHAWHHNGNGTSDSPAPAGQFAIASDGETAIRGIYPAGAYSHLLSDKHGNRLASNDFRLDGEFDLWVRVIGNGQAMSRYVVQNYPRNGTVFPVTTLSDPSNWRWQRYDLKYWNGDDIHVELTTANDAPLLTKGQPRSWFGLREVVAIRKDQQAPTESREYLLPIIANSNQETPRSFEDLAELWARTIRESIEAWAAGTATDAQSVLLNRCIAENLLPNRLEELKQSKPLIEEYRALESAVPVARRIPTLAEWKGKDQPLLDRGDHKKPLHDVPRRFLEAIDAEPYQTQLSGRKQLAADMLRQDNPLTTRVIVNRVWHHLFGRGIVSTADNFGRLGAKPTHPALLDNLASDFRHQDHWSLKTLIRKIVTSKTWQQASTPSAKAIETDPANQLYSYHTVTRLEAESIRDSLLAVSGRLDLKTSGPSVGGNDRRRSVYVRVIRNALDPFLTAFDAPVPFSTKGRRDVTNVPAQSLIMMNNPFVTSAASDFAKLTLANHQSSADRIHSMWRRALGRAPHKHELDAATAFVQQMELRYGSLKREVSNLQTRLNEKQSSILALKSPTRQRLLDAMSKSDKEPVDLHPIAAWTFDEDGRDAIGRHHLTLKGSAQIENGELVLDGDGWARSGPLEKQLRAKTLEAVVMIEPLSQRGGGVFTVQTNNGVLFDSIVIGERQPKRWMAGSNGFSRTKDFYAVDENAAHQSPVRVTITYGSNGTITGYRNGQLYGKPYKTGLQVYQPNDSHIMFGMRHGTHLAPGRMLQGRILEAKLYDRALSAQEVMASATGDSRYVSEAQVLAELSDQQKAEIFAAEASIKDLRQQIAALNSPVSATQPWIDLAHSLFNLKEFIYVR